MYNTDILQLIENETNRIAGGDNYQNVATGTSQSGIEPVNGKRGRGEAGEPYDAGNMDGKSIDRRLFT
jgi:hypothetical protein